jgi:hypothetical protein
MFLKNSGIHDYDHQLQGEENKKIVRAFFLESNSLITTQATLYRPNSKNGDPRLWFSKLSSYASPFNLLAIIIYKNDLIVINASKRQILDSINIEGSPLYKLRLAIKNEEESPASSELLVMLKRVAEKGYIKSRYKGDTSVGAMLSDELGIPVYDMNKGPDFKGIEIKAHRSKSSKSKKGNYQTLFSQIPNWQLSPLHSANEILNRYGYTQNGRLQLYCTVNANIPNQQSLFLQIDQENDLLNNLAVKNNNQKEYEGVVTWELQMLRERLFEKHSETFWVEANVRVIGNEEYFFYSNIIHTRKPNISSLEILINEGIISLDFTLSLKPSGGTRDHGYLFRINRNSINLLIPIVSRYQFYIN